MASTYGDEFELEKFMFLILKSSNGLEFELEKSIAMKYSITIKNMVEDDVTTSIIPIPNVDSENLFKIVEYLEKHATEVSGLNDEEIKNYDEKFVSISFKSLVDIVLAAKYLEIKTLHKLCTQEIAERIKDKSCRDIIKTFDDTTPDFFREKKEAIYDEFAWAFKGDRDIDCFSILRISVGAMFFCGLLSLLQVYLFSRS